MTKQKVKRHPCKMWKMVAVLHPDGGVGLVRPFCGDPTCQRCGPPLLRSIVGNMTRYCIEDDLRYFITITHEVDPSMNMSDAVTVLHDVWERVRRDMARLSPARWPCQDKYHEQMDRIRRAQVALHIDRLRRERAIQAVATEQHVFLKSLSKKSEAYRSWREENSDLIEQAVLSGALWTDGHERRATTSAMEEWLTLMARVAVQDTADRETAAVCTSHDWNEEQQTHVREELDRNFGVLPKALRYIAVPEVGEGGNVHLHILCNYPMMAHHARLLPARMRVWDCREICHGTQGETVYYVTKMIDYVMKHVAEPSEQQGADGPSRINNVSASKCYQVMKRPKGNGKKIAVLPLAQEFYRSGLSHYLFDADADRGVTSEDAF